MLSKIIKSLFKPKRTKAPARSQPRPSPSPPVPQASSGEVIAALNNGNEEIEIRIPDDAEFRERGWIVGNWFNQQTLGSAFAVQQGIDTARQVLQKVAYEITMPSHPAEQQQWFRKKMAQFVRLDPLYQKTVGSVREAIRRNPGMVQSEIYKERSDADKEAARYVLYFAHELGDICREKAGRSYRLYLPGEPEQAVHTQVGDTRYLAGGAISSRVMVRQPTKQEQKISNLHKKATAAIAEKNLEEAVAYLEEAQKLMAVEEGYPIERYLRLPNYLQQAGRMTDAEAIFKELLATWQQGYEQSAIHSQWRIACNRERDYHGACLHGVHSILWTCVSCAEQERLPEEWQIADHWSSDLAKLLKRAKKTEQLDSVLERLAPFFAEPRRDAVASTLHSVQELLYTNHS